MYGIGNVPVQYRGVLTRIQSVLGRNVLVQRFDDTRLYFTAMGLDDRTAIGLLERHVTTVLSGQDLQLFQILCPWDQSEQCGLSLHYLRDPMTRMDYRCGCWFY